MTDSVLALNAGSSSFKFAVAPMDSIASRFLSGTVERIGSDDGVLTIRTSDNQRHTRSLGPVDHRTALAIAFEEIATRHPSLVVKGVGHRIVHGGSNFTDPVLINSEIVDEIQSLIPMAPLHQPHGSRGVQAALEAFPEAKHVACFDSAFHAKKPWVHNSFALPRTYFEQGLRRYGFHGLACESVCAGLLKDGYPLKKRKIVIAHLGNGCSVTAVDQGAASASSMGFSTLEGLTMGTRCGSIDPGVLIHLVRAGYSADDLEDLLYNQSGLLGLSGLSNDMRDLMESEDPDSKAAIDFFLMRLVEGIGRMAAAMEGLDCVVFSGGIGENSSAIREEVARRLAFLPGPSGEGVEYRVQAADEEEQLFTSVLAVAFGT